MDFWNGLQCRESRIYDFLCGLARDCKLTHIPLTTVANHQQMLRYVDESNATQLINYDYHSDLAGADVRQFSCGTWVSYVRLRKMGQYRWIHRGSTEAGDCNYPKPIFENGVRARAGLSDWNRITHAKTRAIVPRLSPELMSNVVHVSVCASPSYAESWLGKLFYRWRKEFDLPYYRGRRDDDRIQHTRRPCGVLRN